MLPPDGADDLRAIIDGAPEMQAESTAQPDPVADELDRLAALVPLDYERERRDAAKQLGFRTSALDQIVSVRRRTEADAGTGGSGRALAICDVEPWPAAVDGTALLDELARTVRRYVVLDAAAADAVALWIVHTHAIDAAYISPRLAITSPEKRCGKTTLLSVLGALVVRPLSAANITPATVFRAIEAVRPCLLVDEADTFVGEAEELRGIINAGHCRATAVVLRTVETRDGHEVREFSVWGPVALAAIGKLPGTIEDRSVKIALHRRRSEEAVERMRLDRLDLLQPLSRRAARWIVDNLDTLRQADPDVSAELHDRAADNWRPLLAIADLAGGDWPERARRAALQLSRDGADDADTARTMLLADLRDMFAAEPSAVLFSNDILDRLHARDDRPWPEYRRGKPITAPQIAQILKPLKILSGTVRRNSATAKGYRAVQFDDAWARYLPPGQVESVTTSHPAESLGFQTPPAVTSGTVVTGLHSPNAAEIFACDGVTASATLRWRERV